MELGQMLDRMLRALVRRAGDGDLFAITELARLTAELPDHLRLAMWAAHVGPARYTYGEIGRELGITRQGVRQMAESAERD